LESAPHWGGSARTNGWLFGCAKTHLGEGGFYDPAGSFIARLEKAGRTKKLYYSPFVGDIPYTP